MPVRHSLENERVLKDRMLFRVRANGGSYSRCYYEEEDIQYIMERAGLTRQQILDWAHNFRERVLEDKRAVELMTDCVDEKVLFKNVI